ncbi:MAG: acyl-CoA dehydrogenase family protein [Mycobacteriales bacterium]
MFFALTDEQRALQDTVRAFLRNRFGLEAVRAVYDDLEGSADPGSLWSSVGEQGWLAVMVPQEYDGLGLGLLDACVIARCWGAGAVPGPYQPTLMAAEAIRLGGSPDQQAKLLPQVAAGELKLALAVRREGGAWSPAGVGVSATGMTLSGSAAEVDAANVADLLVVAARDGQETGLYLVDPADPGVTLETQTPLDRTTRLSTLTLDGAAGERLEQSSAAVLEAVLDRATVLTAADLVGVAREALTRTVAYDKDRVQFGVPVGSFQAIKHALADLHVAITMAEHGVLYAAHALDESLPDAAVMVSVAKAKASDVARDATAAMIQYHGGIGYTWEHDAHFFFKRAKRQEYSYGDASTHRERIAGLVVDAAYRARTGT